MRPTAFIKGYLVVFRFTLTALLNFTWQVLKNKCRDAYWKAAAFFFYQRTKLRQIWAAQERNAPFTLLIFEREIQHGLRPLPPVHVYMWYRKLPDEDRHNAAIYPTTKWNRHEGGPSPRWKKIKLPYIKWFGLIPLVVQWRADPWHGRDKSRSTCLCSKIS